MDKVWFTIWSLAFVTIFEHHTTIPGDDNVKWLQPFLPLFVTLKDNCIRSNVIQKYHKNIDQIKQTFNVINKNKLEYRTNIKTSCHTRIVNIAAQNALKTYSLVEKLVLHSAAIDYTYILNQIYLLSVVSGRFVLSKPKENR